MRFYLIASLALLPLSLAAISFSRNDNGPVDFSEHKVIRIQPTDAEHLEKLRKLELEFEVIFVKLLKFFLTYLKPTSPLDGLLEPCPS